MVPTKIVLDGRVGLLECHNKDNEEPSTSTTMALESTDKDADRAAEEPRALCIIKDMSSHQEKSPKLTMNLPVSVTAIQLMEMVSKKTNYDADTFELVLSVDNYTVLVHTFKNTTLEDLGFKHDNGARNFMVITDRHQRPPRILEVEEEAEEDKASLFYKLMNFEKSPLPLISPARNDIGFVGLVNQAMTCYLNSLLQTLYMTPEFRNALYKWEFDGSEEEGTTSIPYQLQRLFLQLQTSKKTAVGTTELTTSFGWDSSEAWQQHDIQELLRVMFDALEHKFKNTEQHDLISSHYEGKLKDYVKCLECGHESAREDTYLDIPLVVRPFGSSEAYGSVEEALRAFVNPEILDGANQYFCERCNKKCDAHKGLKFLSFPYLLTLQLKRFDFDPVTCHRIKLNDKVVFPEILYLNEFLKNKEEINSQTPDTLDDCDMTDSGSGLDDSSIKASSSISSDAVSEDMADDDEGIDVGSSCNQEVAANERNLRKSMEKIKLANGNNRKQSPGHKKGPFEYELFSIMIHSGSANGGHYYAYIKNFKDGQWFCFNDTVVNKITYDDIKKTYGGGLFRSYFSSYSSSTNAYMLMYRQIDKDRNAEPLGVEEFPEYITNLLKNMEAQEDRERQQKELDKSMCKIKLFCHHPIQRRCVEYRLKIHKDDTLAQAKTTAYQLMNLEGYVPIERCRLVKYDEIHDSLESSFENEESELVGDILGGVKSSYNFDLLLEILRPHESFQVYKPGGTTIKVYTVDTITEEILLPITIRCHLNDTVEQMKAQIAKALGLSEIPIMRVVFEPIDNELKYLGNPTKTLKMECFGRSSKIFIEYVDSEDFAKPFNDSKFQKVLDRYKHTFCIYVGLPKVDKDILERLGIPSRDQAQKDEGNDGGSEPELASKSDQSETLKEFLDEGLGESEESNGTLQTDHSEDSSLTDSERTLVGSPRNNSPTELDQDELWDYGEETVHRYFKAWQYTDSETGEKTLRVYVDKRITLGALKKELEPWVGVKSDYFKLHKYYSNDQEMECTRLSDNLMAYLDDTKLRVKLGRALNKGEFRVKVFELVLTEPEPFKYLLDWIFAKGMTVLQAKKEIVAEIADKCDLHIPLNKCRIRKKNWKNPSVVYLDHQKFEEDIILTSNWEVAVERTLESDPPNKFFWQLYLRWWHPSTLQLDPVVDAILEVDSVEQLKHKISEVSKIPVENLEFVKGQGTFPCDTFVLSVTDMDWQNDMDDLIWALFDKSDGQVLYFRNKEENLKVLTEDEKREFTDKENSRYNKRGKANYSPKKEKALKIYTDFSAPSSATTNGNGDASSKNLHLELD